MLMMSSVQEGKHHEPIQVKTINSLVRFWFPLTRITAAILLDRAPDLIRSQLTATAIADNSFTQQL